MARAKAKMKKDEMTFDSDMICAMIKLCEAFDSLPKLVALRMAHAIFREAIERGPDLVTEAKYDVE